jgi:glycosyltransferase involved in cell wall biosynthesis
VVISNGVGESLLNYMPTIKDKLVLIYNGIEQAYSKNTEGKSTLQVIDRKNIRAVSIGRLVKMKNFDLLIRYIDSFNKNRDSPVLICCRTGQYKILEILLNSLKTKEEVMDQLNLKAQIDGFNSLISAAEVEKAECIKICHKFLKILFYFLNYSKRRYLI